MTAKIETPNGNTVGLRRKLWKASGLLRNFIMRQLKNSCEGRGTFWRGSYWTKPSRGLDILFFPLPPTGCPLKHSADVGLDYCTDALFAAFCKTAGKQASEKSCIVISASRAAFFIALTSTACQRKLTGLSFLGGSCCFPRSFGERGHVAGGSCAGALRSMSRSATLGLG